jgi:hypothetical protein
MKKQNQLLSRIGAALGLKAEDVQEGAGSVVEQIVEQVEVVAQAPVETLTVALEVDAEPVKAALAQLTAQFEELSNKFAELSGKYEEATVALAAVEADKAAMVAAAIAAKAQARKERVEAAIGTEKSAGLLAATDGLDDAAFEAVVSALAGSVDAEAKTAMFSEVGVAAEVNAAKVIEESGESKEMKILKAKYGKK